jgi:hypothetical protein
MVAKMERDHRKLFEALQSGESCGRRAQGSQDTYILLVVARTLSFSSELASSYRFLLSSSFRRLASCPNLGREEQKINKRERIAVKMQTMAVTLALHGDQTRSLGGGLASTA